MRRCGLVLILLAFGLAACTKNAPGPVGIADTKTSPPDAGLAGAIGTGGPRGPSPAIPFVTSSGPPGAVATFVERTTLQPQPTDDTDSPSRYATALATAMELWADKKFDEALAAFEVVDKIKPTETVRLAMRHLTRKAEMESAAEQTANNIQITLDEGKAEDAAKLAGEAIGQFDDTEAIARLSTLKREADSLLSVQAEDRRARYNHFLKEHDEASRAGNKRGAVLALEQALANSDDDTNKKIYDELVGELARYDQLREQAAAARKDPLQFEDALAALIEAQKIWDNLSVRSEIEQFQAALQDHLQMADPDRRERLAVADFEVRGDIGLPRAGAFVADELLPAFKGRYTLMERGQLNKIAEELKLESAGLIDDPDGRREVGRVGKIRYLVVGSVAPVSGITVNARIVDIETGLIVQTAKIVAQTPEELAQRLPRLADELMMTDDEKQAAEKEKANDEVPVDVLKPDSVGELPPPPEPLKELPTPIIPARPKPPVVNLKPEQLDNLAPPPAGQFDLLPLLPAARELEMRQRTLFVALELGDNFFRRAMFRQALWHFEFALSLFPDLLPVRLRVDRCRPLVPPVVIVPRPPIFVRPRLAILDFLVVGNPIVVPPYLGWWTPEQLAPYFSPEYLAVDRSELFWWMGRLGITPFDLLNDPVARLYLTRAMNVRYFLFGNLVQTASFNVTTYLVDAEYGFLVSSARIHVRNPAELKPRLNELAWLTKMSPDERRRIENDNAQWALLFNDIRQAEQRQQFANCMVLCQKALRLRPNNVEVLLILSNVSRQQRASVLFSTRRAILPMPDPWDLRFLRQLEIARAADLSRSQAENLAQNRAAADRQRLLAQREAASRRLLVQAQELVRASRYANSISLYESAAALRPNDDAILRELALARAKAAETARANFAEAQAAREAQLRRQRETELATVRTQLDAERQRRIDADAAGRKNLDERDRSEYDRLMTLAQQLSAKQQYDQAVSAAQKARQLRSTPEADRLVSQLLIELARANAEKKGAGAKADLERQLTAEREARITAEADAAKSRQLYEQLLAQGQQLLKQEKFDEAEEQFFKAKKIHQTDVVLNGLKQVQTAKARAQAQLEAERRKTAELQKQNDDLKGQLTEAQTALTAKQTEKALTLFREAKKIAPTNVEVQTGLAKAEQLRDQELSLARRQGEVQAKRDSFQRLLAAGKANLTGKNYEAAALSLTEANKLFPNDKDAKDALAEAQSKISADEKTKAEMQKHALQYQTFIADGRRFMALKQYDRAIDEFDKARNLVRGDKASEDFAREAGRLKDEADKTKAVDTGNRLAAAQKTADVNKALARMRAALAAGKRDEATVAYRDAAKIDANLPEVVAALVQLRKAQDAAEASKMTDGKFADLLKKARTAFAAKKFDDAAQAVADALKLKPTDAGARILEGQITRAREAMADTELRRRQQLYQSAMTAAREAFLAKKFDDASRSVSSARQTMPNDKDAVALQTQIDQAKKEAGMAVQKRQQFNQFMQQGRTALTVKKFADAIKAFESAQSLIPTDPDAIKALADAKKAMEAAKPPMPMGKPAAFTRQMDQGAAQEKAGKYDQALIAYKAALRLVANDVDADKKVDFCQLMVDGDKAMKARKFTDARTVFESALKLFPDDTNAKAAQQKAKTAK